MKYIRLTKNKVALLKLFWANPDKSFHMHKIGRLLRKKPGVFQRTINALDDEGILKSEFIANARFFRLNKNYPHHKKLKKLVSRKTLKKSKTKRKKRR